MLDEFISPLESLALTLFDIGAVQLGKFKLHSGKKSRIYLDLRVLVSYPDALRLVTSAYCDLVASLEYDLIAATPLAGLPLGTALALQIDKPMIYPRKTAKSYGTGKSIEGKWEIGQTAVVIDDLITSGDSILQTIAVLKASGLRVQDAIVLIDREQGGSDTLRGEGYNCHSVITLHHLLAILQDHGRITAKQHAKVLKSLE